MFRWLRPGFEPGNSQQALEVEALLRDLAVMTVSTEFNDRIDQQGARTPDADIFTPEPRSENREIPAGSRRPRSPSRASAWVWSAAGSWPRR